MTLLRTCAALLLALGARAQAPPLAPAWPIAGASSRRTYRGPNAGPSSASGVAWSVTLGNATAYPIGPVIDGAGNSYFVVASFVNNGRYPQPGSGVSLVKVSPSGSVVWTTQGLGCPAAQPTCTQAYPTEATISGVGSAVYVQVDYSAPGGGGRPVVLPGSVFAVNAASGALAWASTTAGAFFSDNAMPMTEFDGTVLAVDEIPNPGSGFPWSELVAYAPSGASSWSLRIGGADFSSVVVVPVSGTIILWPGFGLMTAVSGGANGGAILWQQNVSVGLSRGGGGGGRGGAMLAISEDGLTIIAAYTNAPFIAWVSVATGQTVNNQSVPGWGSFGYADFSRMVLGPDNSVYICSGYFGNGGGTNPLVALAASGLPNPKWPAPGAGPQLAPPCVMDAAGRLYGAGRNAVVAVDSAAGAVLWTAPMTTAGVRGLALGVAGQLYAMDGNGTLLSVGQAPAAPLVTTRDVAAGAVGAGISIVLCAGAFAVWWFRCGGNKSGLAAAAASYMPTMPKVGGGAGGLSGFYSSGAAAAPSTADAYGLIDQGSSM